MNLQHISKDLLVMFAGGDPWKVNAATRAARPFCSWLRQLILRASHTKLRICGMLRATALPTS